MEFILTIILCSGSANSCLAPYTFTETYPTIYNCMVDGYTKSHDKIVEIEKLFIPFAPKSHRF